VMLVTRVWSKLFVCMECDQNYPCLWGWVGSLVDQNNQDEVALMQISMKVQCTVQCSESRRINEGRNFPARC
jgi:hypothetical protein